MVKAKKGIDWIIAKLRKDQSPNGSWNYPFETGLSTDAYMIILLRFFELHDEELIKGLAERILSRQEQNGAWKLFFDEGEGNLSATIECYSALLYSGYYRKDDKRLLAAKQFILAKGGLQEASMYTKIFLAILGQYEWPAFSPLPIEIILLPNSFPINFYSISVFGRANITPIMILFDNKYTIKMKNAPSLKDLNVKDGLEARWGNFPQEESNLLDYFKQAISNLIGIPAELHRLAIEKAKKYMLSHIEPDGTFFNYYSSTFLMIFALLSLGFKKNDPIIKSAIQGIKAMKCEINGKPHMQYTTATVWNTSLIGYALQSAGISSQDQMVQRANQYLLSRQHHKLGDWAIHNPNIIPGGWGFSDLNTVHPDVDDSTASLRSITRIAENHPQAWNRGITWVLSMQNDDDGWPAFEKNVNSSFIEFIPLEKSEFILTDPSCADLTGRTLEFLGNFTNLPSTNEAIRRGVRWLMNNQEEDGSWYGRWGICYIYGTWAAITGLLATGISSRHLIIQKGIEWLQSIQNEDGGWGESCKSDGRREYVPLEASTLTHTSWALDSLITYEKKPTEEIRKGMNYLLANLTKEDWTTDYPKGQGMAGAFYIHYHSYRYIFPLLALSHYHKKFANNDVS